MNEETARAGIRVREAEKAYSIRTFSKGRGAKKKDPNCIQIRVLLWCRKWDSNPHGVLAQRILSPPRLPIPSFRQICCFKIVSSEIGGRFGGRFWKIAVIQFSKSPKLLGFLDPKRRRARWILSPSRLPIPSHRQGAFYL